MDPDLTNTYVLRCAPCYAIFGSLVATQPGEMLKPDYEKLEKKLARRLRDFHAAHTGPGHKTEEIAYEKRFEGWAPGPESLLRQAALRDPARFVLYSALATLTSAHREAPLASWLQSQGYDKLHQCPVCQEPIFTHAPWCPLPALVTAAAGSLGTEGAKKVVEDIRDSIISHVPK